MFEKFAKLPAILLDVSFEIDPEFRYMRHDGMEVFDNRQSEEKLNALSGKFDPLMVLDVIPKLMNHTVVSMMRSDEEENSVQYLHHSEKALLGYCSYHHMLLELCRRFPVIQQKIDRSVENFIRHESARVKLVQPDLGELLVYLAVASRVAWRHIGPAFLQELFDRAVVWMLDGETGKGHGELAYLEDDEVSNYRLEVTFQASLTGLRLLMFQVFFLEQVGRPQGATPKDVLKRLNYSYGQPPAGVPTLLQKECEKIYSVKTWPDFFKRINLPCPSKAQMTTILRQAVQNSERKGYHVNQLDQEELRAWREKAETVPNVRPGCGNFPRQKCRQNRSQIRTAVPAPAKQRAELPFPPSREKKRRKRKRRSLPMIPFQFKFD